MKAKNWRKRIRFVLAAGLAVMALAGCGAGPGGEKAATGRKGRELQPGVETDAGERAGKEEALLREELFADKAFGDYICGILDIPAGASDEEKKKVMAQAETLTLNTYDANTIKKLDDLKYFTGLKYLELSYYVDRDSGIEDFSGIGLASNLETLYIIYQKMDDLSFVEKLPRLKELYLVDCGITDISILENARQLERLSLYGNRVEDAAPLESLTGLVELTLNENQSELRNYGVLEKLTEMQDLGLSHCGIRDLEFVRNMTKLQGINVNENEIEDLSPLMGLEQLERLGARSNRITDISPLKGLTGIYDLALDNNRISDIAVLKDMNQLSSLGISQNTIQDLSVLEDKDKLFFLNLGRCPVEDITPVLDVPYLTFDRASDLPSKESERWEKAGADWVEKNRTDLPFYVLEDIAVGDLNGDGREDAAIVFSGLYEVEEDDSSEGEQEKSAAPSVPRRMTDQELESQDFIYGDREVCIFLGQEDGGCRKLEDTVTAGSYASGGMRGDPYRGIRVDRGYVLTQTAGGSRSGWCETDIYQFDGKKLLLMQSIVVGDDNFSYGYDVNITDYREKTDEYYVYAQSDNYNYVKLAMSGGEKLECPPRINLYYGSYLYFEEYRSAKMSAGEALDRAAEEIGRVAQEMNSDLPMEGEPVKREIGYTALLKENYERLKGIVLPDYYYYLGGAGKGEVTLGYNLYGRDGEENIHEVLLGYLGDHGFRMQKEIWVNDDTGEVTLGRE